MSYKYKSPEENGYTKVKVNKKGWNKHFKYKNMKFTWNQHLEIYHHPEKGFIVEKYHKVWIKPLAIILLPIAILVYGLANYREITKEHVHLLFQKKYGSFTKDAIYQSSVKYLELVKTIKK